ncbi:MAG: hypothetical protein NVSMB6_09580 [Burkholderiaceae bacterium]
MNRPSKSIQVQSGFSMIEVMVSLVILLLGLLGLVGLILTSQRSESESYQRSQALLLLQDMAGRISANRRVAACYAITTDTVNGAPYLGKGSTLTPSCGSGTTEANTLAINDLTAWNNLLTGTAETLGGSNVGAMIGARGCVSFDTTTSVYMVSIAWQGIAATTAPPTNLACGMGLYGDERLRRAVSMNLQFANLN